MGKIFSAIARFFARLFAVIFAILFVVAALLVLFIFNAENQLFSADTYKTIIEEQQVYDRFPTIIAEQIALSIFFDPCTQNPLACEIENGSLELQACLKQTIGEDAFIQIGTNQRTPTDIENRQAQSCLDQYAVERSTGGEDGEGGPPDFFKNLTVGDWERVISNLMPPEEIQSLTENTIDQIFGYLNGDSDTAKVPLRKLKERLGGQPGVEALVSIMRSQPPCSAAELNIINAGNYQEEGFIFCNPPDDTLNTILPDLQEQLRLIAAEIPDTTIIFTPPAGTSGENSFTSMAIARLIIRASPLLPLGLLLAITLLVVRSLKGWLRWWGIPFLISGVLGILIGASAIAVLNLAWKFIFTPPPYFSPSIIELTETFSTSLAHSIIEPMVLQSLIMGVLGLGMIIAAVFIKPKNGEPSQETIATRNT